MKRLNRQLIIPGDLARKSDNNVKKQKRNKYMAQPINIEDLQNRRKVKAYKIGFKKGRTPADIYHVYALLSTTSITLGTYFCVGGMCQLCF